MGEASSSVKYFRGGCTGDGLQSPFRWHAADKQPDHIAILDCGRDRLDSAGTYKPGIADRGLDLGALFNPRSYQYYREWLHILTFGEETWGSFYPEVVPLWEAHAQELSEELNPNYELYASVWELGILKIWGARAEGRLQGYVTAHVYPHAHHCHVLYAYEDLYYLSPLYRKGRAGIRLLESSIEFLRGLGVQRVVYGSDQRRPTDAIFKRMPGMKLASTLWVKDLVP